MYVCTCMYYIHTHKHTHISSLFRTKASPKGSHSPIESKGQSFLLTRNSPQQISHSLINEETYKMKPSRGAWVAQYIQHLLRKQPRLQGSDISPHGVLNTNSHKLSIWAVPSGLRKRKQRLEIINYSYMPKNYMADVYHSECAFKFYQILVKKKKQGTKEKIEF